MVTGVNNIELFKQVLNEQTDNGEYTELKCWKVDQKMANLLDNRIKVGDYLIWDPETRRLRKQRWHTL